MSDPFACLGIMPSFSLSLEELDRRYFELQKEHHPDFGGADLLTSSSINSAYQTLKNPYLRAKALLIVLGGNPELTPSRDFLEACLDDDFDARKAWKERRKAFEDSKNDLQALECIFCEMTYLQRLI